MQLLARQPNAGIRLQAARRRTRYTKSVARGKPLGRQGRPKVRTAFPNKRHHIITSTVANPVIGGRPIALYRLDAAPSLHIRCKDGGLGGRSDEAHTSQRSRSAEDRALIAINPIRNDTRHRADAVTSVVGAAASARLFPGKAQTTSY